MGNPTSSTWLLIPANGYLEPNLQVCCERYFQGSEYNDCISGGGGTLTPTNKFYPAWDQSPHTCAKDCAEGGTDPSCGGILGPGVGTTYTTVEACCAKHFSDQIEGYCVAMTNGATYAGSNEWYLDASENICVKDCETAAACCKAKLNYLDEDPCAASSIGGTAAGPVGNSKWYADYSISPARCVKNCAVGAMNCQGILETTAGVTFYDDVETCCEKKFSWYNPLACMVKSTYDGDGFTLKFYADYGTSTCVMDCPKGDIAPPGATCGGSPDDLSTHLFDTAEKCCKEKLSWINEDVCQGNSLSTNGATHKWLVDYSEKRCVKDCAVTATDPDCAGIEENKDGLELFDTN